MRIKTTLKCGPGPASRGSNALINHPFAQLAAAMLITLAGITQALAFQIGLAIENSLDSNGNISVVNGGKVKVAFQIKDPKKELHKKDRIELRRVDDDSVVSSTARGKKNSGTASLKVKKSENEPLYVAYVRRGETDPAATASHPGDTDYVPLMSIANLSMVDLIIQVAELESRPRANVADVAPDAGDDNDSGYPDGSVWVDTSQNQAYILVDGSAAAAVWRHVTDHADTYAIGDTGPAGGIVFYVTEGGAHGLEAAPEDLAASQWGCFTTSISGADGTSVGSGAQNNADVIAGCATAGIAARLADAYSLNGYNDWFLPSKDALAKLYNNRNVVGGFSNISYWSSSEFNNLNAWYQRYSDGFQTNGNKNSIGGGRAIRAF